MTDTTSPPQLPPPLAPREARIFRWIRGLGVVRANRWVGGVCGGIAARVGIDPVIVRGLFVVAALIGFPALAVYLVCWMLLPDLQGRVPLQQLARTAAGPFVITLGVVALVLIGLVSLAVSMRGGGGLWWLFGGWWWSAFGLDGLGQFVTAVFGIAVMVGLIVVIVRLSTRHQGYPGVTTPAPNAVDGQGASAASDPSNEVSNEASNEASADASVEDVAHWRLRQDQWRTQHDAWRRQQADADATARAQLRREREEQGRAFAVAAQERAEWRRRTRPRTSALTVIGVIGAALVGAALTAFATAHLGVMIASGAALLVGAIVCATGMTVAGLLRRRSGFLASVTSVLLVAGVIVGYLGVIAPDSTNLDVTTSPATTQSYRQAFGNTTITVVPEDRPSAGVRIEKAVGAIQISVESGAVLALDATLGDGHVFVQTLPADGSETPQKQPTPVRMTSAGSSYRWTGGSSHGTAHPGTGTPVHIDLGHGDVFIYLLEESK